MNRGVKYYSKKSKNKVDDKYCIKYIPYSNKERSGCIR